MKRIFGKKTEQQQTDYSAVLEMDSGQMDLSPGLQNLYSPQTTTQTRVRDVVDILLDSRQLSPEQVEHIRSQQQEHGTDVEPLLAEPDVHLRIVRRSDELGTPDCIILPGSKNVVADLDYLAETGLGRKVMQCAEQGREVVGICGGFQMLGSVVTDPFGLEGEPGSSVNGLSLLQLVTELAADKTLTRRQGIHVPTGEPVHGYEIHHGLSSGKGAEKGKGVLEFSDGGSCGCADRDGRVWGSYLHGIFDSDPFRRHFINRLRKS